MINLLNSLTTFIKGTVKFPEWEYVRKGLQLNTRQAIDYYRHSAYSVKSDHEIIKLLASLDTSVDMELMEFYKRVDSKALMVGQQLGFTTTMSVGKVFNNVFFGKHSKEVIIITDEPFDVKYVHDYWMDCCPVRILKHGFDYIDNFPLDGTVDSNSISVFTINLSMLAVQYRAYRQWQKTYVNERTGRNSIYHFVYSYPLNNMRYDAIDHAILNRLIKIRNGLPTNDNQTKHPFHVTNFTMKCDRLLLMINESLMNMKRDLGNVAMTIPLVNMDNVYQLLKLPDVNDSRQINWAIYIARIEMLLFLMSYPGVMEQNTGIINALKYELRSYLRDGTIRQVIDHELYLKHQAVIESL